MKLWFNQWAHAGKTVSSITLHDSKPNEYATEYDRPVPSMMDNLCANEPVVYYGGTSEGKVIFQCVTTR